MRVGMFVAILLGAGLAFADGNIVGAWTLSIDTPRGTNHPVLTVVATDTGYAGTMNGRRGDVEIPSIVVDGNGFSFPMQVSMPFGVFDMTYVGVVDADTMQGEVQGPRGGIPFTGERSP